MKSAEKINTLVANIQNDINSAVIVTKQGTKTVEGSMKIAQKTAQAFAEVMHAVNDVVINNEQISFNLQ